MKNLMHKIVCAAATVGTPLVLASTALADSTKPVAPHPKPSVSISGTKKAHAAIKKDTATADFTVYDAAPGSTDYDAAPSGMADSTVYAPIPGTETLTPAQAQQSLTAAQAGKRALAAGNLGAAEAAFRLSTGIVTNAANVDAVVGLAQTLEREGKYKQAIPVYRYLLNPKHGWGTSFEGDDMLRMHFALLLVGDKQWAEAVSVYEKTIGGVSYGSSFPALDVHFSPNTPQPALLRAMAHLVMGITYKGQGESTQALTEYAAAVRSEPSLALAHYYHGLGLSNLGRRVEAKAAFAEASNLDGQGDVRQAAEKELHQ